MARKKKGVNEKLNVMLCVPGRHYPAGSKHIIAQVKDGDKLPQYFTFGASYSPKMIYERYVTLAYSDPLVKKGWRKSC